MEMEVSHSNELCRWDGLFSMFSVLRVVDKISRLCRSHINIRNRSFVRSFVRMLACFVRCFPFTVLYPFSQGRYIQGTSETGLWSLYFSQVVHWYNRPCPFRWFLNRKIINIQTHQRCC